MHLIIFVIALLKILQKEKHNNLCSLPPPARNSAIERLNICIDYLAATTSGSLLSVFLGALRWEGQLS